MLQRLHLTHSPQRKLLAIATGSHTVRLWTTPESLQRPSPARTTEPPLHVHASLELETHHVEVLGIQFLNARTLLVIHTDGVLQCWHVSTTPLPDEPAALLEALPPQPDDFSRDLHCGVFTSRVSPPAAASAVVQSGSGLHAALCWEIEVGVRLKSATFRAHSETGSVHAGLGGVSGEVLWFRFAQSGFLISRYLGHMYSCINLTSLSHNGELLVTSSRDHRVAVWRPFGPDPANTPWHVFRDSTSEIWSLALSHSSRYLAGGGIDNGIYLWDLESEDDDAHLVSMRFDHTGWISELAWADQDRVLACSSWDNTVGVYRGTDLMPLYQLDLHTDYVSSVMFVPDTTLLVSASYDQQIAVWDWSQASLIRVIEEHDDWVQGLVFSGHGTFLSASSDRVLKLWSSNLLSLMGSFERGESAQLEEQRTRSLESLLAASGGALAMQSALLPGSVQQQLEGSLARQPLEPSEPQDESSSQEASAVGEPHGNKASVDHRRRTVIEDNRRTSIYVKNKDGQLVSPDGTSLPRLSEGEEEEEKGATPQVSRDDLDGALHDVEPPASSVEELAEPETRSANPNPFARQGLRIDGESLSSGRLRSPSTLTEELSSLQEASLAAEDMDVLKLLGLSSTSITILPAGSNEPRPAPASSRDEAPAEEIKPLEQLRAKLRAASRKKADGQASAEPTQQVSQEEEQKRELSRGSLKALFARHVSKSSENEAQPPSRRDPETYRKTSVPPSYPLLEQEAREDVTRALFGDLTEVFEQGFQDYLQQQQEDVALQEASPRSDAEEEDDFDALQQQDTSLTEEPPHDISGAETLHASSERGEVDASKHDVRLVEASAGEDAARRADDRSGEEQGEASEPAERAEEVERGDSAPSLEGGAARGDEEGASSDARESLESVAASEAERSEPAELSPPPELVSQGDDPTVVEELAMGSAITNPFSQDEPTAVHDQEALVDLRRQEVEEAARTDVDLDVDLGVSAFPSVDSNWDIAVDFSADEEGEGEAARLEASAHDDVAIDAISAAFSESSDLTPNTGGEELARGSDVQTAASEDEPVAASSSLDEDSAGSVVSNTGKASPHVLQTVDDAFDDLPSADDAPTTAGQHSPPSLDPSSLNPVMRAALSSEESSSWFEADPSSTSSSSSNASPSPASTIGDSPTNPQHVREVTSSGGLPLAGDASSSHGRIPSLSPERSRQSEPLLAKEPTTPNDGGNQERNDQTNPGFLARIAADSSTAAPFMGRPITQSKEAAYDSSHPGNVTSFGGLVYRPEVEPEPELGGNEITADAFVEHDVSEPISQAEFATHTPEWSWIEVGELWKMRHKVNQAAMKIFKRRGSVSRQPWVRQEPIVANLHNVFSLAARSESDYFAAGGATRQLAVWHMRGELLYQLPVSGRIIYAVTATPDGKILVCGDDRAHIDLWLIEMTDEGRGLPLLKRARLEGHSAPISHLAMNTSGRLLFSAALDGSARLWNLEDGVCVSVLDHGGESLSACTFWGSGLVTISLEGVLRLWDRRGIQIDLVEGFAPLTCMAAKRSKIYFGSRDGEIFCYEKGQTSLVGRHDGEVTGLCIHLDGTLISSSRDGTIKVHDEEGANPTTLQARAPLTCIEIDTSRIIAGTEQGDLEIFTQSRP